MSKRRIDHLAALIATVGLMFVFAACGETQSAAQETPGEGEPSNPAACLESDQDYLLELATRYETFEIYADLAGSTPRLALAKVIAEMGDHQIDLVSIRPTRGCTGAFTSLNSWMGSSIKMLSAFLAQASESRMLDLIRAVEADKRLAAININGALEHIGQAPQLTVPEESEFGSGDVSRSRDAPDVEVVNGSLSFRVQERNNVWWKFAYKFTLRNNTSREQSVNVDIKFLDSDDFVVDDARAYGIDVPAFGTTEHSDSTLIDRSEASSVVSIRVDEPR